MKTTYSISPLFVDRADILDKMNQGITIITGNQRLTHAFRHHFDRLAVIKKVKVWLTPDILPWNGWLHRLWDEALVKGDVHKYEQCLTPRQELAIWQDIIASELPFEPMSKISLQAQQAWQLLWEWRLPQDETAFQYNDDSRLFWKWQLLFQHACQQKGWLSAACLPNQLQNCFERGILQAPDELVLIGFDELIPQQLALLGALDQLGCKVNWLQLKPIASQVTRIGSVDKYREARLMARWVRQKLEDNPQAQVGIVVPELTAHRNIVVHALDEILIPHVFHPGCRDQERPYNVSLGKPLSSYPMIMVALKLFDLLKSIIPLRDISPLFHSPFIAGWEQESSSRAMLDAQMHEIGESSVTIDTVLYHASVINRNHNCAVLARRLELLKTWLQTCPRKGQPGQWVQRFAYLLKTIGWLEGYRLSSEEFQTAEAWHALLAEFASLDWVMAETSLLEALNLLWQMARERIFQPQTGRAPVQILGPLEAHGMQFDYLWMMGLHDNVWPPPPQPNPFIPLSLQRKNELPRASEQRELAVTRMLTQRIVTSADQVIVSYPQLNGDEELRASPLIKHYPFLPEDELLVNNMPAWRETVYHSACLSEWPHDPAPALGQMTISGGSRIFKLQAMCPFRAFAELRLGARSLGQVQLGLNAMTRGNLLHRIMEKVWNKLDSQERLLALTETQLGTLVLNQVKAAIEETAPHYPQTFTRRFRNMEINRLQRIVTAWLELEKARPPFQVIEKEKKYEMAVGNLNIQLKIDRIDEIVDGRRLIIDYKTGQAKASQWFGDRPDEPQLPLYSLIFTNELAGMAFAQLRAGQMAFNGITVEEGILPGVKAYQNLPQTREIGGWSQVLAYWLETMKKLSYSFQRGEAEVDPKQYPATCAYCTLQPLCRINELTVLNKAENGAEKGI